MARPWVALAASSLVTNGPNVSTLRVVALKDGMESVPRSTVGSGIVSTVMAAMAVVTTEGPQPREHERRQELVGQLRAVPREDAGFSPCA